MALLEIRNLTVSFDTSIGLFKAVEGIDLSVDAREVLAIVGESGSGKSVEMLAVMGLLPSTATVTADKMEFDGKDLLSMSRAQKRQIVGRDIAMIFQEPVASLNPCFTVGFQIDPDARFALVPNLVLQPLVENAIRHGIAPRAAPGHVMVTARRRGDRLDLSVTDDGVGESPSVEHRDGVGLGNTRARLLSLYGADHRFEAGTPTGGSGFAVTIEIPYRTDPMPKELARRESEREVLV